jgi:hypothetical protein
MSKQLAVLAVILGMAVHVSAEERGILVTFNGGIGVQPVSNVAAPANADGTFQNVVRNIVRGVVPGGGPWRIDDLRATVTTDGRIRVIGRGLLLASGNRIGQNGNQSVFATLICDAAAPFIERSTAPTGVALSPNGDFRIDDVLSPVPTGCASPVLLIRNLSGAWFAAGIVAPTGER